MPKLQAKPIRDYTLNDIAIKVKPVPGKELMGYFKAFNENKDDYEKLFDMFVSIIIKYTDLENTEEELAEFIEYNLVLV
jgi:hypothetical protein